MEIGAIRHIESCENYSEIERRQTPRFAMLSAMIGENNGSIRKLDAISDAMVMEEACAAARIQNVACSIDGLERAT